MTLKAPSVTVLVPVAPELALGSATNENVPVALLVVREVIVTVPLPPSVVDAPHLKLPWTIPKLAPLLRLETLNVPMPAGVAAKATDRTGSPPLIEMMGIPPVEVLKTEMATVAFHATPSILALYRSVGEGRGAAGTASTGTDAGTASTGAAA